MQPIKRIAFSCHIYHRGGVTRWMADAALAYAQKGYEVYFLALQPKETFFSGKGQETMLQLLAKEPNKVKIISQQVDKYFEFETPEAIVHTYMALLSKNLPIGTPIIVSDDENIWKSCTALHSMYPIVGVLHADDEAYYSKAEKYWKQVDVFVSVSNRITKTVHERYPQIPKECIHTVPCGISLPEAGHTAVDTTLVRLIYVGRIENRQKRTMDLAALAQALLQQQTPFHLTIIGDGGDDKTALQQKIAAEQLGSYITFAGWQQKTQVLQYMRDSDIMVLVSAFEGMPVAMMEALASGCAFVGTRVSGVEDYEQHPLAKDCFGVFAIGDVADAAQKIKILSQVPSSIRSQSARKLAEEQFSMDQCLSNYLKAMHAMPQRTYQASPVGNLPLLQVVKSKLLSKARYQKMKSRTA